MRMLADNICIKRPENEFAIYKMSGHKKSILNPERGENLFTSVIKMKQDGLLNLELLNVTQMGTYEYPLFTKILVNVSYPDFPTTTRKTSVWTYLFLGKK